MAISVDPGTKIISVPQSYLTFDSGIVYRLDTNQLRLDLRDWEDNEIGVVELKTHEHSTSVLLSGVTYARIFKIINGYTVEFEDTGSHYTIICEGSNHNLADVMVQNAVNLIIGNSAGLIEVTSGSGLSTIEQTQLKEIYTYLGLDAANPIEHSPSQSVTDGADIDITRSGDGENLSRLERQ